MTLFELIDNIVPFMFISMGLLPFGFYFWNKIKLQRNKKNYYRTTATIIKSTIKEQTVHNKGASMKAFYSPDITFQYQINSKNYTNDKPFYCMDSYSSTEKSNAQSIINKYPPKAPVQIYVNRDKPEDSFIEFDPPETYFFFFIGFIMIASGSAIYYFK